MSHIGMNDVPSYIEFTPRDFDSDIERDPPSCAEDSSFCDDTSRFAEQKIEVIKPSQQDVEAPYYNIMPAHMTSHPDDESQQDLDAMDWMVHNSIRRQDWLHRKVSPSIIEHDNMKLVGNFEQQDLDVSASDLQQMILDIRCSSPHEFVNQCTLSLSRATNKLVVDAGDVDTHASPGVSGSPLTSYNVSQPRAVFTRKDSQTQRKCSSLSPGAAMSLSSTIPPQSTYNTPRYLTTHRPATPSYCQECYAPCSRPPLMIYPQPKKRIEDIPGFNIRKFGPMPFGPMQLHWPSAA